MGHQIGKPKQPTRGSQAFIPRVRAKRHYPRIKNWPVIDDTKLLGFAAYKAGMAHVTFRDNSKKPTKGEIISVPVTILEVPKIKTLSLRLYGFNKRRQIVCLKEIYSDKLEKDLKRKISMPKKKKDMAEELKKADETLKDSKRVRLVVYTLPNKMFGKKKPDIFEIAIGGKTIAEQYEFAKSLLGKEISVKDILQGGEQVDTIAVTKGKGFQGATKRIGAKLQPRGKSDRGPRMVATIGPDVPRKVNWRVGMPGQMGFHNRYDYNKWVIKVGENGEEVTPKGGFSNYGKVKGEYIMLAGSIPGARKRLVRMRLAINPRKSIPNKAPEIINVGKVGSK